MKLTTLGHASNPYTNRVGSIDGFLDPFYDKLVASEWRLIELMKSQKKWIGPDPIGPSVPGGSIDYGTMLFLLNNTSDIDDLLLRAAIWELTLLLAFNGKPVPKSKIDTANYCTLATADVVWDDGSIMGTGAYQIYDQRWMGALRDLINCVLFGILYGDDTLPLPPAGYRPIRATSKTGARTIVLGLLSDWGTGEQPAQDVMSSLVQRDPDYIVHLGDVYYAGSPLGNVEEFFLFSALGEENQKLVQCWPQSGFEDRSFTLNSNHEMYTGGTGYFQDGLNAPSKTFSGQGGCSMFALAIGDWTVVALDSAYYSDPRQLYMYGWLDRGQVAWLKGMNLDAAKTIILTHHTGFDYNCDAKDQSQYTVMWERLREGLGGRDPYAWYWGHVHNGIVYTQPVRIQATGLDFSTYTYCRCLGHGALPFGVATKLTVGKDNVAWFATQAVDDVSSLVCNGYATLEFTIDELDVCQRIEERFFDYVNRDKPCYAHQLYPAPVS